MTQAALMQSSETGAKAATSRIADLRASLEARRAATKELREGGARQSASKSDWTRHLGSQDLRAAIESEKDMGPLEAELAALEAVAKPTTGDIFGAQGMLIYAVARSLLISIMGIFMFSATGTLLRAAREQGRNGHVVTGHEVRNFENETSPSMEIDQNEAQNQREQTADLTQPLMPAISSNPPMESPLLTQENEPSEPEVEVLQLENEDSAGPGDEELNLENENRLHLELDQGEVRYQRVLAAIRAREIRPTVLEVRALEKMGAAGATAILARLEREGVTVRSGRTWQLVE
jgi:hypothetical protein